METSTAQPDEERVYSLSNAADRNRVIAMTRTGDGTLVPLGSLDPLPDLPPSFATAFGYTPTPPFPTGGRGSGGVLPSQGALAVDPKNRFLYAVNAGSDDISSFAITQNGLRHLSTVPSGGVEPRSLTVHDDLIYVVNGFGQGQITGFRRNANGILTPLPGSEFNLNGFNTGPVQISFSPTGRHLVVTELFADHITVFTMSPDGVPTGIRSNTSAGESPFGFAFNKHGNLIVSESFGFRREESAVSSYRLQRDGRLEIVSKSIRNCQTAACWIVNTPDGRYSYTSNTGSGSVTGYSVDPSGELTLLSADGRTGVTGSLSLPIDMVVSADGEFLYVLSQGSQALTSFRIERDGQLAPVPGTGGLPPLALGLAIG